MTMIDVETILANQVIAALVASAFYIATYLSFVRLLRYPRNWFLPSLPASLTTGVLAVLTILLVSLTPDGIDLPALATSAGFILVLFYIIAAPAIAFQPSSRQVEFLAKHGDYAGLWLIGPALLAALAISNIKLQALLSIAMVIELSWFVRLRWADRRRHLYSLRNIDILVLKAQAKGNLEAFRRRHGIRELVLSNGAVNWNGCGKGTSPCPFNLYVNRLGLNTAPCCREHMKDLSYHVAASLSEMGVVHWLEGGTLLGAVREKGTLIDWEDDIDISVLLDGEMTWDRLMNGLTQRGARDGYYVDVFEKKGLVSISFDPPKRWPFRWERNRHRGEIRTDIAIYRKTISYDEAVLERQSKKGAMPITESGGYGVPQEIILPTSTISFVDREFSCPNQPEAYLHILYGDFRKIEYTYIDAGAVNSRTQVNTVDAPSTQ